MRNCLFFGSALLLFGVPAFAVPAYTFQTVIDPADTNFTQLLGIDNSGTIAGYFGDGMVVANNGFTLALPGTFTPENYPASLQTQVVGINNTGETVGFFVDGSGVTHGFTDFATILTAVTDPFAPTVTQLLGVNDSGEAAGYYTDCLLYTSGSAADAPVVLLGFREIRSRRTGSGTGRPVAQRAPPGGPPQQFRGIPRKVCGIRQSCLAAAFPGGWTRWRGPKECLPRAG